LIYRIVSVLENVFKAYYPSPAPIIQCWDTFPSAGVTDNAQHWFGGMGECFYTLYV